MKHTIELRLKPEDAHNEEIIERLVRSKIQNLKRSDELIIVPVRRSIDARGREVLIQLQIEAFQNEVPESPPSLKDSFKTLKGNQKVIIVGAGPAGYFAAIELLMLGIKPIVLDRGKDVRSRRRDLKAIQQDGIVNPHSNYCFGEGGAGTYSDGKLYTRSTKRGDIMQTLRLLVEHGATSDILLDAHPHIGSNKLPQVVANLRETIIQYGGEVIFEEFVTDFIIKNNTMTGVVTEKGNTYQGNAVILATGHSARDIYYLLHQKGVRIEAKPFALGVRAEHSQQLIDEIQYHQKTRNELLPAASYKLVCQVENRGVFSFCMCPGGLIVPSATAPGEIVVNGMSMSRRDSPFANSGIVVAVEPQDLQGFQSEGVFAGLAFQRHVEQTLFAAGDGSQKAPAQRLTDFIKGKVSSSLFETSYIPGVYSAPLHELLPASISKRLQLGFEQFGKSMKGYYTHEANVVGTESRTSSPIRIPRQPDTFMHPETTGLFPCGEGAGYAGGIVSAAMDGQNVAKAIAVFLEKMK